ncbi:P1 family peptidase [Aneurinibacillus terranovensis]|uniref:P1 family peptidase n=1 Tax=Aneurinibacillus terranovensis TaxID=278991 RepID=UPI0004234B4D|nr:P1 family peptidase [Aneurinibacillus terranovensis]
MDRTGTIVDVPGVKVGHAHDEDALTGCTVILTEQGATAGVDVRGSAPGTRETDVLAPMNLVTQVHAVCLTGGSAFGLDAAGGVMKFLEERGCGLDTGFGVVPIVPAAALFDLPVGNSRIRPDREMGYQAALTASREAVKEGNVGAGCGVSVGKLGGFDRAMKSGLGSASRILPDGLVVGAVVAVNAVGEVRDPVTNEVLAGVRDDEGKIKDILSCMTAASFTPIPAGSNTTIAVVASNANLTKVQTAKVAQMSHNGLARTIYPVHTMYDGDTVFALATGGINANVDLIGMLSADVLAEAIVRAIRAARGAGGLPSHRDLRK